MLKWEEATLPRIFRTSSTIHMNPDKKQHGNVSPSKFLFLESLCHENVNGFHYFSLPLNTSIVMFVHMPRQFIFSRPKNAQHIFAFKAQNENQSNQLFRNLFREQEMVENEFFIGSFIIHYVFQFFWLQLARSISKWIFIYSRDYYDFMRKKIAFLNLVNN